MHIGKMLGILLLLTTLGCGGKPKPKGGLIVQSTPTGLIAGSLTITLAFSRPMVGQEHLGSPVDIKNLHIEPSLRGEAQWSDPHTLTFSATQPLARSTQYVATVDQELLSVDGRSLDKVHQFAFHSKRIKADIYIANSTRAREKPSVSIRFNQEVALSEIEANCHFFRGDERIASVLQGGREEEGVQAAKKFWVLPAAPLHLDTDWVFRCSESLRGIEGNWGLAPATEKAFRTFGPLSFIKMQPEGTDIVPSENQSLRFSFSNPLGHPYHFSISPKVQGFPERCHSLGTNPAGLQCGVMLKAQTAYTVTIGAEQRDTFGQKLGKEEQIAFRTSDAEPTISMESGYFVAELERPVLPMWARNVEEISVTAVKLTPANYHKIVPILDWYDRKPAKFKNTGLRPVSKTVRIRGKKNRWSQTSVDPAQLFGGKSGPGMYYVEVGAKGVNRYPFKEGGRQRSLVNFTDIGIVSKLSGTKGLVWTTRLSTGQPLAGVSVSVRGSGKAIWSGTSDAQGIVSLPGRQELQGKDWQELRIFAQLGQDWTMVNGDRSGGLSSWNFNVSADYSSSPVKLRGFMHSDRGLYRPGEAVHIKGLARETRLGSPLKVPTNKQVKVRISGPRGKTISTQKVSMSHFGGFWLDFELPGDARLGDYHVHADLENGKFSQAFAVEEYRPATFEIKGKTNRKQLVRRGTVQAKIEAKYFYGAPLREGTGKLSVYARPRRVSFPMHEGFSFADQKRQTSYYGESTYSQQLLTEESLPMDSTGAAAMSFSVSPSDFSKDADILVRASVTAPSNEVINTSFTIPYFRYRRYFGIKKPGYFIDVGKAQEFEVVAVKPDGTRIAGQANVTITRNDWNCVWEDWGYRGTYQCKESKEEVLTQTVEFTADASTPVSFTPEKGGSYYITVSSGKDHHATAATHVYAWGDGGGSWRDTDSPTFDIISDKTEYKVGDTATLILQTNLSSATGLVTIERDGVIEKRLIEVTDTTKHIQVPITGKYAPNIYVSVALVQGRVGTGPKSKPQMRMGLINLPVRPEDNTLKVVVRTDQKDYRPGGQVRATVKVTDAQGNPVAAEVAITAADEGVLSLIGFKTPNPVPTFYAPWGYGLQNATQYAYLRDIPGPNQERPATGGDSGAPGSVRSRFVSTPVWKPGIVTNAQGIAKVTFQAPDNLTAFRMMAVAADSGTRFGSSDKRFTISKPLQLHRVLPRFLTRGDKLQGGVIIHNETGKAGKATIALKVDKGLTVAGAENGQIRRQVEVPVGGRVPVLFPITASELGVSTLTFSLTMDGEEDAVAFKLPVQHPSPVQVQHVAHGATSVEKSISLAIPPNADPESVQVAISVDRDGLAGIEEGLRNLIGYPYGCLEQTTSKIVPMVAVRGLAESLHIQGLQGDELDNFVNIGIAKIGRHQTAYGGFSLWPGGEPDAFYTAYALWGLYVVRENGFKVDATRIEEGLAYLRGQGKRTNAQEEYYSHTGHLGSQSLGLYVRALFGDKDPQSATRMLEEKELPIFGKAFLAHALAVSVGPDHPSVRKLVLELSTIANAATDKMQLIAEPDKRKLSYYMSSSMRTTAIVLDALIALDKNNPVIAKLVHTIMHHRRGDRYITTQGNLYSLMALMHYADAVTGKAPSAVVSLGDEEVLRGKLRGKERMRIAMLPVVAEKKTVTIKPVGNVHYNIELRYRERPETIDKQDNGLAIQREYLDENRQPKSTFQVGDVVLVRLTIPLAESANHLMISDHIPAGFEVLNTRFATVGTAGVQETRRSWWGGYKSIHDDRVDFSSRYNWGGTYVRQYMMRAIAVGTFRKPPAVAELMYQPERNGRTAMETLEVTAK